jgi:hypothetical protein
MVPSMEFPPATPLTFQLTLAPEDAVNCCVCVMMIDVEAGSTVKETWVGGVGVEVELLLPPPQLTA